MSRKRKSRRARVATPSPRASLAETSALNWKRMLLRLSAIALVVIGGALGYFWYAGSRVDPFGRGVDSQSVPLAAAYVGAKVCAECHAAEYDAWKGSQHAIAMQHADTATVLGNFDNAVFSYGGISSRFFKRDGKFFVNTDGPDDKLNDYEIKFTFGVSPLQQYLIQFPDGRLQPLSIAWDSRSKQEGGQRWFHLYPKERIRSGDELHWTGPAQNWNYMCADCHSTELRKNYDAATDSFKTKWTEINVGCEACHGPGSKHLSWAQSQSQGETPAKELTVKLDERIGVSWNRGAGNTTASRSRPRITEREIDVCAQCHARRGQIADGYVPGKPFLDYYRPALLTNPLYYVDGQQRDEVYIWGSFLQSKMYAKGVTCSDCHNPHSGKLRADGNQVCATCHDVAKYDAPSHHHHKSGSAGAACASCHMPTTKYMVVDPRHDHSLRVPRPDLSIALGTPNACNNCHAERDSRWAAAQITRWYGHAPQGYQRFAGAFAAADKGAPDAAAQLRAVAADRDQAAVARATAVAQLNASSDQMTREVVAAALSDRTPLIRLGALQSLANSAPETRAALAPPLLADPLRALRIEAASLLAAVPQNQLNAEQSAAFERAAAEYVASQRYNADRANARVNLGTFYANRGDGAKAEDEIKTAIRLEPSYIPAYVNLSDFYRTRDRDGDGERILRDGLKVAPKSAVLHHALGLTLVRLKRSNEALAEFARASALDPGNARYAYVNAVALHSTGQVDAAIAALASALLAHPDDGNILSALASFHQARGDTVAAKKYTDRLRAISERNKQN